MAVSPVIGVILMVAITVILAAVIAAFVFGMGPPTKAPSAQLTVKDAGSTTGTSGVNVASADVFTIQHKGGDTVASGEYSLQVRKQGQSSYVTIPINGSASGVVGPDAGLKLKLSADASTTSLATGTTLVVQVSTVATTPANVLGTYEVQLIHNPSKSLILDTSEVVT